MEWKHYQALSIIKDSGGRGAHVEQNARLSKIDVDFLASQGLVEIHPLERTASITMRGIDALGRFNEV